LEAISPERGDLTLVIPLKKGTPGFSYEHRHPVKKRLTLRVDKVIGFHRAAHTDEHPYLMVES
jgi:hypothetical protein